MLVKMRSIKYSIAFNAMINGFCGDNSLTRTFLTDICCSILLISYRYIILNTSFAKIPWEPGSIRQKTNSMNVIMVSFYQF